VYRGDDYLSQSITWGERDNLQPGNLTEKRMGRTAKWFMATDFGAGDQLHDLLARHSDSASDVYARSAAAAVETDNKCAEAATDSDIFVLVLAMAGTFCGGVNAFLQSIHLMLNWIFVRVRPHSHRETRAISVYWVLLPTYELGLTALGATVFFALYLPFILQVITEFEIYNFMTSGLDLGAVNLDLGGSFLGSAMLVPLGQTETQCDESRPFLLAMVLGHGLLIGVLVNIPQAHMAWVVLCLLGISNV